MRRGAALALILAGALLFGCAREETVPQHELAPPFWTVQDEQTGGTLYLLGSMHVGTESTYYPDYVMEAYADSNVIVAELDTTVIDEAAYKAVEHLLCPEGTTAETFFGEEYARTADFFESKGLYTRQLDRYLPCFWSSYLSNAAAEECGLSGDFGTESFFLNQAHEDGKEILEIESYDEQYRMMAEMPMSIQVLAVTSEIEEAYEELLSDTLALYEAWSQFDKQFFEELDNGIYEDVPEEYTADYAEYVDRMYNSRQKKMADFACELLQSGETSFMLVGAAHYYVGEDILGLLEAEGYKVTEVRPEEMAEAA